MLVYCSHMSKPRRKAEIRADAHRKLATLRDDANARAAFLQPESRSWHDRFLHAIRSGDSIEQASLVAGITRQGVFHARRHLPRFSEAFQAAYKAGGKARRQRQTRAYQHHASIRNSTMKGTISTQNQPDDSVTLGKSDFTLRVGPNGPAEGYPLRNEVSAARVQP
jgi:hypothetical protein